MTEEPFLAIKITTYLVVISYSYIEERNKRLLRLSDIFKSLDIEI